DLVAAMRLIEDKLGAGPGKDAVILRPHRIGDMGMITARQAIVYAEEYDWNDGYEALVAKVTADFIENFEAGKESCWVAERNGAMLGSVFVVRHRERPGVARLRLLYVERAARGLGVGRKLVQECTRFARSAGYHTMTLWTQSILKSAHRIYEAEGYTLVHEQPNHMFGKDLVSQTWELDLRA
ncbi:MAG TPA: GNAT family N-acetyltransferase, partial [Myxococcota bacterium]|nr:GNAT family N-acetyltransferase [Myxococcota bacterium]